MTLLITIYEAERNFSKLPVIIKKSINMLEERLNYLSILSVESDITKSVSFEEAIKEYAAKT
jgi:hypothetical protein